MIVAGCCCPVTAFPHVSCDVANVCSCWQQSLLTITQEVHFGQRCWSGQFRMETVLAATLLTVSNGFTLSLKAFKHISKRWPEATEATNTAEALHCTMFAQ